MLNGSTSTTPFIYFALMKIICALILSLFSLIAFAQTGEHISIGVTEKLHSSILKEDRKIFIYNPGSGQPANAKEKYPVLYLLDAEDHFYTAAGIVKQMAGRWPQMIIVGITNNNRTKDLTPALVNGKDENSGGNENFLVFIEKELIPHIDSLYPAAPYRIISGHSLGGLTVVNAFVNHTNLFNAYIAIDPSLWWDDQQFLKAAEKQLPGKDFTGKTLFIARANNMPPGMDTLTAINDKTNFTAVYRSATAFVNDLKRNGKGLRWASKFYPEESHGTVELNAFYDGLKFLFNYYQFRTTMFDFNPSMNIDSAVTAHFKNISKQLGYTVLPSQDLINNLGYTCLTLKKYDKAESFFKMNIINNPNDANPYDSLGDLYVAVGDNKKAIENFRKALTLGNDPDTRRKLESLENKKP